MLGKGDNVRRLLCQVESGILAGHHVPEHRGSFRVRFRLQILRQSKMDTSITAPHMTDICLTVPEKTVQKQNSQVAFDRFSSSKCNRWTARHTDEILIPSAARLYPASRRLSSDVGTRPV